MTKKIKLSRWFGRFGNNIIQLANATNYAINNNFVFESDEHEFIEKFIINDNIKYTEIDNLNHFFTDKYDCKYNRYQIIQKFIKPHLKNSIKTKIQPLDSKILLVHIRSGDIFKDKIYNLYVQNPLDYFVKIINRYNKTIVLYEDYGNPVLDYLSKIQSVTMQSGNLIDDIATFLSATNVCLSGVSTFGPMCCALSDNVKKIYATNISGKSYLEKDIFTEYYKINLDKYIKIGEWVNSDKQRELMITYKCDS